MLSVSVSADNRGQISVSVSVVPPITDNWSREIWLFFHVNPAIFWPNFVLKKLQNRPEVGGA